MTDVNWTFGGTKAPLLLFVVVGFGGTPQLTVWAAGLRALRVPLLPELERKLTRDSESVAPYCENGWSRQTD